MYYKQALKPNELLPALSDSGECFFIIRAALPIRNYQVAIVEKEFIRLDLLTLQKMTTIQSFEILFYEFFDF